ncbi:MAG TPA: NADH-dependent [FeFe] hydrogenase, group A6 [Elusimicrobiales bacterium]|nr:NADH-dependent [FeFe] hydrogenase, group A6 [Elusimicrobiales bacterium]
MTKTPDVKEKKGATVGAEVSVTVDGMVVKVPFNATLLDAAIKAGIRVPTLCHHEDLRPAGLCRVCVVEVEGQRALQAACAYPVTQPLVIRTRSPRIRKARKHAIELMLSEHYGDCCTCARNDSCELQALAKEYGADASVFGRPAAPRLAVENAGPSVVRDMNKCVLCRRCARTCEELQGVAAVGAAHRGEKTSISACMDAPLSETACINCGQCINRCPTGALSEKDDTAAVWKAIDDPTKHVVIQTAPAPRAAIGEEFGLPPGTPVTWKLNSALRAAGFDRVFDTNFTADLTIIEEGTELIKRLYSALVLKKDEALPQFTSCSPGWVKYLEHFYPEFIPNLSSAKSPQQMFGALIKTWYAELHKLKAEDIVAVALMPCTAKKFECSRPEMRSSGLKDVDYGLTTRECARLLRQAGVELPAMPDGEFDDPFGTASGSGVIFGATGGVMEAALRSVLEFITGEKVENFYAHADVVPVRGFEGCRYIELKIPEKTGPVPELISHLIPDWAWLKGQTLKIGVAHGTANARKVMEDIKKGGKFSQCHFIEFMACPGGCLGGGGQPIPTTPAIRKKRAEAIYAEDAAYGEQGRPRKSHENPAVLRLYREYLTDGPCGKSSHLLLHTHYTPRGKTSSGKRG